MYPPINLPCFLVSEEPGVPKALKQARNPARGGPSPSLRSSDLPRSLAPAVPVPSLQEDRGGGQSPKKRRVSSLSCRWPHWTWRSPSSWGPHRLFWKTRCRLWARMSVSS